MKFVTQNILLPLVGIVGALLIWTLVSRLTLHEEAKTDDSTGETVKVMTADIPSPLKTWEGSKLYITKPFEKRGELDQGVGAFLLLSLGLVAQGYALALVIGTPIGFLLGSSKTFERMSTRSFKSSARSRPSRGLPLGY